MSLIFLVYFFVIFVCKFSIESKNCSFIDKRYTFAHRGGDTTKYQENTLEIVELSALNRYPVEIDLQRLSSGELIVFHDFSFYWKTGYAIDADQTSLSQLRTFHYNTQIDGFNYTSTASIPLFSELLHKVCTLNSTIGLWLDIKFFLSPETSLAILQDLESSPCACSEEQLIIVEIYDTPSALEFLQGLAENFRCQVHSAFAFPQEKALESLERVIYELDLVVDYVTVLDIHQAVYQKYPGIIDRYSDQGICLSIYGFDNPEKVFDQYEKINIEIVGLIMEEKTEEEENFMAQNKTVIANNAQLYYVKGILIFILILFIL